MKRFKIVAIAVLFICSLSLFLKPNKVMAFGGTNYELTGCTIYFPDGTFHLGAQCIQPLATGPCDGVAPCQGGAPPPSVQ